MSIKPCPWLKAPILSPLKNGRNGISQVNSVKRRVLIEVSRINRLDACCFEGFWVVIFYTWSRWFLCWNCRIPRGKPGKRGGHARLYSCRGRYDERIRGICSGTTPTPNFNGGVDIMFWVISSWFFVELALQDSGQMSLGALLRECWSTHSGKKAKEES